MNETPADNANGVSLAAAADFADFDDLVESLARWVGSGPDWPPARRVRAEWEQVAPRLDRTRR